ncbi:MAG TPA: DUF4136 domain-containing protein [Steroidobacteraceae bacterium]|nr:DUF4136 domain-containing protein [Steroidobacteraceae bacterium]
MTSLLAAMFLAGCATAPTVRVDQDAAAKLSQYRTFGFYRRLNADQQAYSTLTTSRIKEATIRELERLGYRHDESNPDLLVNFSANVSDRVDVNKTPAPMRGVYGYRVAAFRGWSGDAYDIDVRQYKAGTLIIDLIDAGQKQLVWRGIAEGELHKSEQKDPAATIDRAVTGIFAKFTAS